MTAQNVNLSRRSVLMAGMASAAMLRAAQGPLVDTHVHLFAADQKQFPFAPGAPYQPKPFTLEQFVALAQKVGITRAVIVHPEPYQDDHRYLEYCFAHAPTPDFFKGTCLFDPAAAETPQRMEALTKKYPRKIVGLRVHETRAPGVAALTKGPIKDRDLGSAGMRATWAKAQELGLILQMHCLPHFAPQIGELAAQFPRLPVLLDHLARSGQGQAGDFEKVLALAKLPQVYVKYSGVNYSSKEKYPFADVQPMVQRFHAAFGADRMLWGGLGTTVDEVQQQQALFDRMWAFASAEDREKVRTRTALRLFGWSGA